VVLLPELRGKGLRPDLLAGGGIEAVDDVQLGLDVVALGEEAPVLDGHGGVAEPHVRDPDRLGVPGAVPVGLRGDAVEVRAAPLRPIAAIRRGRGRGADREGEEGG